MFFDELTDDRRDSDFDDPNPFTPLRLELADYDDCYTEEERAQECYEAMQEALWYIAGEFVRMDFDAKFFGAFVSGLLENSGGLHENMVEQNENP